jgi:aminopeptidase N
MNRAYRDRLGPIGHGWRASTNEIPAGYQIQTYHKGPLVVHMLRTIIAMRTGSDEPFFKTLKDFLAEYDGKAASTEDFRRVLERNLGGTDMSWFFDSWIYRAEIPSYTWKYSVKPDGDAFLITVDIERRDVPEDFVAIPCASSSRRKAGYVYIANKQRSSPSRKNYR